jgi:hypothetical protein
VRVPILVAVLAGLLAASADAKHVLYGKASVYANDPVLGFVDHGDNNLPALAGATNNRPGIAVLSSSTLGHWWRVCWLARPGASGCRWVRQTDYGPASWTGRVVDVNAVAARVLWGIPAYRFPTDVGMWKVVLHGRTLTRSQLRRARFERCNTRRCRRAYR